MEVEYVQESQRSSEEEEELCRCTKKYKDRGGDKTFTQPRRTVSYKESLIGDIPGTYAQAFKFDSEIAEHEDSDTEVEELVEGMTEVVLSKETKARIRSPWAKALIVKVYGRTVGFSYLTLKVNALWKPMAKMDCVNLGKDFFLIKFSDTSDYDKVLKGGPWFVGEHFLAIKPWEPYFKASEATFNSVAVWVRLPELPIEFYDPEVLRQISGAIGPVLRIDSYTATSSRGSYARLCIQVNLEKPLITTVKVGRLKQKVMYEGIGALCFCCGRLGHKQEFCSYKIKPREAEIGELDTTNLEHKSSQEEDKSDANYGAWMLVTRKRNIARIGRGRGPNQNGIKLEKGKLGTLEPFGEVVGPSFKFKALDVSRKESMDISLCRGEGVKSKEVVSHTQLVSDHRLNPMVSINPEASSNGSSARDGTHSR